MHRFKQLMYMHRTSLALAQSPGPVATRHPKPTDPPVQTRREGAEHHSQHELSRTCTSVSRKMRFHRSNLSLTAAAAAAAGHNITPSDRSLRSFKVFSQLRLRQPPLRNRAHFSLVMGSSIKPDPWGDSRQRAAAAASPRQRQSLRSRTGALCPHGLAAD